MGGAARADKAVCTSISKCCRQDIGPKTLLDVLKGRLPSSAWKGHLSIFSVELPVETVVRYVESHDDLTWRDVLSAYRRHISDGGDRNRMLEEWMAHG